MAGMKKQRLVLKPSFVLQAFSSFQNGAASYSKGRSLVINTALVAKAIRESRFYTYPFFTTLPSS